MFAVREELREKALCYSESLIAMLSSQQLRFDSSMSDNLPRQGGVYSVLVTSSGSEMFLYVGRTNNLRQRVYSQLFLGNQRSHTLRRKLIMHRGLADEAAVTRHLSDRCGIQYIQVSDEVDRMALEHFAIAILRPVYNDYQKAVEDLEADLDLFEQRDGEPSRPFPDFLAELEQANRQ